MVDLASMEKLKEESKWRKQRSYIKKNGKQRKLEICLQNKIDKVKIEPVRDTSYKFYDSSRSFKTWKILVTYTGFIFSFVVNFVLFSFLGMLDILHSKYHDSVYSQVLTRPSNLTYAGVTLRLHFWVPEEL